MFVYIIVKLSNSIYKFYGELYALIDIIFWNFKILLSLFVQ